MPTALTPVTTIADLRAQVSAWRKAGDRIALVPTMGALHQGHLALVARAQQTAKRVAVSIFVNPLQFAPTEDLSRYPRQLAADRVLLEQAGADLLYAPTVDEMYGAGAVTTIDPGPLANVFEGAIRPGHFSGVATVVMKLFNQVQPDCACFGEKDFQQLLVIKRVTSDLDVPVQIIGVPIIRDADGLALSSRNVYLSAEERGRALALPQALQMAARKIAAGEAVEAALQQGRQMLAAAGFKTDYLALVSADNLTPLAKPAGAMRLIAAAKMGTTRLIDNLAV